MHATYSSEVLARTKKYRETSYFNTPSRVDTDSKSALKGAGVSGTILMTSPTNKADTVTVE